MGKLMQALLCLLAATWLSTGQSLSQASAHEGAAQTVFAGRMLSLDEAVQLTLRLLPAIATSEANKQAADARIVQARSPWLPALTGSAAYARQTANFVLRPGNLPSSLTSSAASAASKSRSFNYWSSQLQLSQLLFDFGATAYGVSSTKALARQSQHAVRQAVLEATLATRKAFFSAQGSKWQKEVAAQTLVNQQRHKDQIAAQVAVGQRPPIDLAQADTDVSNAKVTLIQARNTEAIALATLMQAMGVEGLDEAYGVNDDTLGATAVEECGLQQLLVEALAQRPEMRGLHEAALAQRQKLRSLEVGLLPQVTGVGSVTDAGQKIDRLGWNWTGQVTLSWPLLSGGNSYGQIREAQALYRAAQANLNTQRNTIHLELRTAQLNVQAALLSVKAAEDAVHNASYQLTLAEGRYTTGLGGVIELGDAQLAWATARSQKVQAEVSLATARASLLKALGRAS